MMGLVTDGDTASEMAAGLDEFSGQVVLRMAPEIAEALADHLQRTAEEDVGFQEMAAALFVAMGGQP